MNKKDAILEIFDRERDYRPGKAPFDYDVVADAIVKLFEANSLAFDYVQCSINEIQCAYCGKWHLVADEKLKKQITKRMIEEFSGSSHCIHEGEVHTKSEAVAMFEYWLKR